MFTDPCLVAPLIFSLCNTVSNSSVDVGREDCIDCSDSGSIGSKLS